MNAFLASLREEIRDPDEEIFDVFSQSMPSQDLGMADPKATTLELSIAGRDFVVVQSPGILQSSREGGTTGAAVWQASIRFAEWAEWSKNPLFTHGVVSASSTVLELGSGVSGIVSSVLSTKVQQVVATDQPYILKILQQNMTANAHMPSSRHKRGGRNRQEHGHQNDVKVFALDWENDDVPSTLESNGLEHGVDLVIACDCIYNYALTGPLVQTCVDICRMRQREAQQDVVPTICVIVQQIRQPDVFGQWLEAFHQQFRVWRVPSDLLSEGLREGSGFIVHIGAFRG